MAPLVTGTMKSITSPTASTPKKRVTRMLVSGRYSCLGRPVVRLDTEK
jgi:hypothetical protein